MKNQKIFFGKSKISKFPFEKFLLDFSQKLLRSFPQVSELSDKL